MCAAFAGDLTGYWIGRASGPRIMSSKAGRRFGERWVNAQKRVDESGMIAVATGRWLGFVRTVMPPAAGIVPDARRQLLVIADVVGVVTWGNDDPARRLFRGRQTRHHPDVLHGFGDHCRPRGVVGGQTVPASGVPEGVSESGQGRPVGQ